MRLKEQWIREGFSTYYTVKKEKDLTYEKEILLHHPLSCLLPCEFRMENEDVFYYYETGIYRRWKDEIGRVEGSEFFFQLILAFEQIEAYLLNLDHIKLTFDLVFLEKDGKPVICYVPEYEKNIFEQMRELLESCIDQSSHKEREKVRFYYEFHKYLVREKPNMEQLKVYFMDRLEEDLQIEEEEKRESSLQDWEEEETESKIPARKRDITILAIYGISFLLSAGFAGYFLIKIFIYGWYYPVIAGFSVSAGILLGVGFGGIRYMRDWKDDRQKSKCVKESAFDKQEEKTELLNYPTVLLTEDILGTLISQRDDMDKIIISENGFVIGSSGEGTDYQLERTGISRRHLKFCMEEGSVVCEDMESTNGTKVNGKKIKKVVLKDGDKIQIGLEIFEFLSSEMTPTEAE